MTHTITANDNVKINLAPQSVVEEVLQNVAMILSTQRFSVPLFRNFGLSAEFLSKPTPVAESMIIAEVYDCVERYEPRAEIANISFLRDELNGRLTTKLEVAVNG